MRVLLILSLLALNDCGKAYNIHGFESYIDKFEQDATSIYGTPYKIKELEIRFGEMDLDVLGLCTMDGQHPIITINSIPWPKLDDSNREKVIYHEMGHCLLGRTHDINRLIDGDRYYESLMLPTTKAIVDYDVHRASYIKELFTGTNS